MAAYDFVALNVDGKRKKGTLEGDSARQIRQTLRDKGWFVESVALSQKSQSKTKGSGLFAPSMSVADLALITRQLATLVGSGMPIEECLKAAAEQSEKAKVRSILLSVRGKVLEGFGLASALQEFPKAFPALYHATVSAGEHSGHLDSVLNRLADYMEEQQKMAKQIQIASIYPSLLTLVALGIIAFLLNTVVPDIVGVFTATGESLPVPTQVLLVASDAVQQYWLISLIVCLIAGVVFVMVNKKPSRKRRTHRWMLGLPLIGRISKGFNTSRFVGTMAMLTSSGVPLVDAMKIAAQVVSNLEIKQRVSQAAVSVSEGGALHSALKEAGYFRPMMLHMIASGEASGDLDNMLEKTADSEERAVQDLVSTIIGLFEPLMLILMGGIVLIIVLAIVLPIMQMNSLAG